MAQLERRVLSIQSHVVSGYVGNKSATFPLQILGFEVDTINSVQFSNHTGYGSWTGQVLAAKDIDDLMIGLRKNNINHYSHLLTGYMGAESFLLKIVDVVKELKQINPHLIYVCDPVMGDNGQMYVPPELLPVYRDQVIPLADIITPNQFEAELLSGIKIKNEKDALEAMKIFHAKGIKTVVLSSTELGSEKHLVGLASTKQGDKCEAVRIEIPKFGAIFTGSGDLFAALFLAWMTRTGGNLKKAMEITVGTMQDVLTRTLKCAQNAAGDGNKPRSDQIELKLIQSKDDIENVKTKINATPISV